MPTYIRLTDYKSSNEKEQEFFNPENRYEAKQEDFSEISGIPIAYWISDKNQSILANNIKLGDIAEPRPGLQTSDNDRFLKLWFEIGHDKIGRNLSKEEAISSDFKWFPHNKGGKDPKKWYGNIDFLINFLDDGKELKHWLVNNPSDPTTKHWSRNLRNYSYYFQEGMTWSAMSSNQLTARINGKGFLFDTSGPTLFGDDLFYLTAYINSIVFDNFISIFSQTLSTGSDSFRKVPIIFPEHTEVKQKIEVITQQNIDISKEEWDSRETSWDFKKNELVKYKSDTKIEIAYSNYCDYWSEKFVSLHKNEEELNRLFIDIYELDDELDEYVDFNDITILKNETKIEQILIPAHTIEEAEERAKTPEGYMYNSGAKLEFQSDEIMKQFISYGVGVMFGRYSLDNDGLIVANMGQEIPTGTTFAIDDDNVIPVLEDDYFTDDIASRFVQFVKATFGEEDLSENIRFIESSLGTTLRKYFVKGFYEDHIKRYKKRPIYWMVASPKKGFMSLMYMHRYQSDVFARVQNAYLREYITKLEATLNAQTQITNDESNSNPVRKDAQKQIDSINKKLDEIIKFDRDHLTAFAQGKIEIDLDDGVKVNYCKFKDVLYPITGLCK